MTPVVAGTDFSPCSAEAMHAAAAIAKRKGRPLVLVNVASSAQAAAALTRLQGEAATLASASGIEVEARVVQGSPHEAICALADQLQAELVVVGSLGDQKQGRWLLGSVAERVAQTANRPVLVARAGAAFEAWTGHERALKVMVAVERTPISLGALRWAESLAALGECEIAITQIVWPAEEQARAGLTGAVPLDTLRPELEQKLLQELVAWADQVPAAGKRSFVVKPGWGRVDSHITKLAADTATDLIVVGTHRRSGIARLWQGSVSRGVLAEASMSVACIGAPPGA